MEGWMGSQWHCEGSEEWEWQTGADIMSTHFPFHCCQISPHAGLSKTWRMAHGIALSDNHGQSP